MTWMQTFTGKQFNLMDIDIDCIDIRDIAHALSLTCRFSGHCKEFYSVAQHSVHVSHLVPPEHALVGLLHDAAEAYLTDIPRPFKSLMPDYKALENYAWSIISQRFKVPYHLPVEVKQADMIALVTERRDLIVKTEHQWEGLDGIEPDRRVIKPLMPRWAENQFIDRFVQLSKQQGRG